MNSIYTNSFHLFGTKLTQLILPDELYIDRYSSSLYTKYLRESPQKIFYIIKCHIYYDAEVHVYVYAHFSSKVSAPQDAHKQISAAGFPWLKHFRIQWYIGKNFGSKL